MVRREFIGRREDFDRMERRRAGRQVSDSLCANESIAFADAMSTPTILAKTKLRSIRATDRLIPDTGK